MREKHLARAEEVSDDAHPVHQGAFDHGERAPQLGARFLGVRVDEGVDALHEGVREARFDRPLAPRLFFFFRRHHARRFGLQALTEIDEALGRVGAPVQKHVLHQITELGLDLFVDREHSRVHDPHVHPGGDRVVEERRVHRLADHVVAAEAEGDVRDAAADLGVWQVRLDPARRVDEVQGVVVVLLDARTHREDVGVEDHVLGRESDDVDEQPVGALADANLVLVGRRLPLLVERHDDDGGAVPLHRARLLQELRLALFQRDGVHDAFALKALEPCLQDLPLGRVDHEGDFGHFGLAREEEQEARHRRGAVDHPFVHADVDDVRAALDLLARDADGSLVVPLLDQLRKLG